MGLIKLVASIVGFLVLAVIGLGAYLYFTDYQAEGTITQKGRDAEGDFIVLKPQLVPYDVKKHIDTNAANFVCEGYQVTYRLQSQHYRVLDERGRLVYDSDTGLNDALTLVRCNQLGLGNAIGP